MGREKKADEPRNQDRSNTETYGPKRGASQPIRFRTRDFTGSSLCHMIIPYIPLTISFNGFQPASATRHK